MSFELDDVLAVACHPEGGPCLIELARAWPTDPDLDATTACFWSTGRIGATVGPGWARIRRRLGNVGRGARDNDLLVNADDLRGIESACGDWAHRRDDWAAFFSSAAGYPPGFGAASYYQPPGKDAERTRIGTVRMGQREGSELQGVDEYVDVESIATDARTSLVGEIWRRGESLGPADGSLVGVRYELPNDGYVFDARRHEARIEVQGVGIYIEPGEEAFITSLRRAVERSAAR